MACINPSFILCLFIIFFWEEREEKKDSIAGGNSGKQSMKCRVCMLPNRLSISTSSKHSTAYIFFLGKQVAAVEVGRVVLDAKDRSKEKRQEQSQKHPTYYQFSFLSKILL